MEWKEKIIDFVVQKGPGMVGTVIIVALIAIGGFMAARRLSNMLVGWLTRKEFEPPVRMLVGRIAFILVLALAALIAAQTVGIEVMPLVAGLGVAGVGISFAMQGVLSNLVAGLIIIFTKPYRVGEYIDIIGEFGQVQAIDLMSTTLAQPDKSRVIIPNRKIVGEVLQNYGTIRQHNLPIGVAYASNIPEVMATIREVLNDNARILKEIPPIVGIAGFGDSSINLFVRFWTSITDFGLAGTEVYQGIIDRFREKNIQIPFPQREIRMLNGHDEQPPMPSRMATAGL